MTRSIEIVPTCVPKTSSDIGFTTRLIKPFASSIHIDVTDGRFAPELTWPYTKKGAFGAIDLSPAEGLLREVHLMVQGPRVIGGEFARAGAWRVLGHVEAFDSEHAARAALDLWRGNGAREVGLAALLATPLDILDPLVPSCDVVHLMSIATIGTQGIPYETSAPARVADFHARHPEVSISVDGGVSEKNIADLVRAGASRFGVGAAIVRAAEPKEAYARLQALAEDALL